MNKKKKLKKARLFQLIKKIYKEIKQRLKTVINKSLRSLLKKRHKETQQKFKTIINQSLHSHFNKIRRKETEQLLKKKIRRTLPLFLTRLHKNNNLLMCLSQEYKKVEKRMSLKLFGESIYRQSRITKRIFLIIKISRSALQQRLKSASITQKFPTGKD